MRAHEFPGNVRELKNIMEFAAMVCTGEKIRIEHLPGHLTGVHEADQAHRVPEKGRRAGRKTVEER